MCANKLSKIDDTTDQFDDHKQEVICASEKMERKTVGFGDNFTSDSKGSKILLSNHDSAL